ncbi:hypothetical protein F5B22DRAFT_628366 [Xylaria bambusicola]|uniref:uncharacterized protein n=1 Tax=Xylaria bambusicola TaxID=326684 RepID=UPI002007B216|nr:uncharacterized protein F5B22DRAFT_628366 [Xylaria bambusicola]KAI0505247.1 hypothetical protein F5B22DRAFT_628366 [Xylaria bambusicola]
MKMYENYHPLGSRLSSSYRAVGMAHLEPAQARGYYWDGVGLFITVLCVSGLRKSTLLFPTILFPISLFLTSLFHITL